MHTEQWVVRLTDVSILPIVGETGLGTLEAHANGFRYLTGDFHVDFMHANIEGYFFQLGIRGGQTLLQFHLQNPIMVGNVEAKDIQFFLEPILGEVGFRRRDEELKNFVHKVQVTQWTSGSAPFQSVEFQWLEEFEFYGKFPKDDKPATLALTDSALVVLTETPFFVVPLNEIEIVNLARLEHETIVMTVVFRDYKRDVLEVHSIPLKFLTNIKHGLNSAGVKYYVNSESRNWSNYVREIAAFPEKFKDSRGWDSFEDQHTLAYYPPGYSHSYPKAPRDDEIVLWGRNGM